MDEAKPPELDSRKQTILQAIIVEYVHGAEPVGSELITKKYSLGVRSATIRNEMAEMLDLGFLEQPHTSSGRVPSDLGYRYYVDRLVVQRSLDENLQGAVKNAAKTGDALQGLLQDTVRVMSHLTHLLSVATTVRDMEVTVRTALVSALGPTQALLVFALSNGHVENRMVSCPEGLSLDDLGRANELLSSALLGRTLKQVTKAKAPSVPGHPVAEKLLVPVWQQVQAIAKDMTRGRMVTDGEEFMLAQPEFRHDVGALTTLLDEVLRSDVMYESVAPGEQSQAVTIGKENRHPQMYRFSIIRNSFYVGGKEAGVVALIGPTRLAYESGIPLVNFTAKTLSDSLTRFFGQ
ncbi:MAG: heat-inducible transcriptional repressor HrcA [Fimbriimonas sp.]